jgi:hypothetical protein
MKKILLIITCVAGIVVLQYGFLFLVLALLPSLVAYYIESDPKHPTFKIVFATNAAATLPSLMTMIHSLTHLKHLDISAQMADATAWLFIYSGAAFGWAMIFLCRLIARFIISLMYEYNIAVLEGVQKGMVQEWGEKIRKTPDDDVVEEEPDL